MTTMALLTETNFDELETKGYTVVANVLTSSECDETIGEYKTWLSQFKDDDWPQTRHSLIQGYNTGHMRPTWFARLKSKKVFEEVWKTDKLLTSFDAIAIGRPPEEGEESFQKPDSHWLHVDQSALRIGLHAYQGAVYLEESCEDDWTMQVMENSHNHFDLLFKDNPKARITSNLNGYWGLKEADVKALEGHGCTIKRVPVPKGGMVLWDSRTVHANARPLEGRANPGRWRYCVFVSMTPAVWASSDDMGQKEAAYKGPWMTTHWSSQDVRFTRKSFVPFNHEHITIPKELPDIAKTTVAKQLSGVIAYDFRDGRPTALGRKPRWDLPEQVKRRRQLARAGFAVGGVVVAGLAYLVYRLVARFM